jgi:hypothetical protein
MPRNSHQLPSELSICGDISDSRLDDHLPGHYSSLYVSSNDHFNNILNFGQHDNQMSRHSYELPRELSICSDFADPGLDDNMSRLRRADDNFCFYDLWHNASNRIGSFMSQLSSFCLRIFISNLNHYLHRAGLYSNSNLLTSLHLSTNSYSADSGCL